MHDAIQLKRYIGPDGGEVAAVQLTEDNFKTVAAWLNAEIWHSGTTYAYPVGLTVGEYEDATHLPFGWWVIQGGGETSFLADVAFADEYTPC